MENSSFVKVRVCCARVSIINKYPKYHQILPLVGDLPELFAPNIEGGVRSQAGGKRDLQRIVGYRILIASLVIHF